MVWSLGQEDPLEKEMATHSSILAWEIPCTEEPGGLQSMGLQRVGHDLATEHACLRYLINLLSSKVPWWKKVKVTQLCPTLCDPGLYTPWNSLGQNTGVGSLSLLQGIFPTQVSCTEGGSLPAEPQGFRGYSKFMLSSWQIQFTVHWVNFYAVPQK